MVSKHRQCGSRFQGLAVPLLLVAAVTGQTIADEPQGVRPDLVLPAPTVQETSESHRDRVMAAQFSPTGQYLVLGMESGHMAVWNFSEKDLHWAGPAHDKPVKLIAFGAEDRYALSGADDLQVTLWDLESNRSLISFEGAPLKQLYDIALSMNARFAVSRGFDGFGVVWDLRVNRKVTDLFSYGFAVGPHDAFVVSTPRRQPGAQILRLRDGAAPKEILGDRSVQCVAVDPTGATVACGSTSDQGAAVLLVGAEDGQVTGTIEIPATAGASDGVGVTAVEFSSDARQLAIGCSDGRVIRADVSTQQIVEAYACPAGDSVARVAFVGSRDRYVLAASLDVDAACQSVFWHVDLPKPVWQKPGPVTIDGRHMRAALTTTDGDIVLFDATNGKPWRQVRGFQRGTKWLDER